MFGSSSFDKILDSATSHLHLEPEWTSILLICDAIRQNDVTPKQALTSIKKKMNSPNPHTAAYALTVLESVVKNCGSPVHDEICTKENCEMFTNFIETTTHENVKSKMLELIQTWAFAFRTFDKYQAMKDTVTILKAKGFKFPKLKEADAMFTSETAPDWTDGKVCHRCRVAFSLTVRKHHCRNCGQIFCGQCSSKFCRLPKFGIEREVRVCEGCYTMLQAPLSASANPARMSNDSELPVEYLTSSLAQQSQTPPRKTEQELKEEEELELALALSQSEAEQQKQKSLQSTYRSYQKTASPEPPSNNSNPQASSVPADDGPVDAELAKYLNRDYWQQRKPTESPASPSAPSPMSQTLLTSPLKIGPEEMEIDEFSTQLKTQVEIFVNRMKSNSSRGRSISTDSSVQTLFINLTASHSRLLAYIKEMDDRRMWFEQLQDKLNQVKDSRAALDVLRQEHLDKLRRQAEEAERQRQLQMAYKLEVMRKKKQEYLQYQRQLALQRIQEQERELQMRQEQQKAYHMGVGPQGYPYMAPVTAVSQPPQPHHHQQQQQPQQGSPIHQMVGGPNVVGAYTNYSGFGGNPAGGGAGVGQMPPSSQPQQPQRFVPCSMPMQGPSPIPPPQYTPYGVPINPMNPLNPRMMNMPQHPSPQQQQQQQQQPQPSSGQPLPNSMGPVTIPQMGNPTVTTNAANVISQPQPMMMGRPHQVPPHMAQQMPQSQMTTNPNMIPNDGNYGNINNMIKSEPGLQMGTGGIPQTAVASAPMQFGGNMPNNQIPQQQQQQPHHQQQQQAPQQQQQQPQQSTQVMPQTQVPQEVPPQEKPEVTTGELISFD